MIAMRTATTRVSGKLGTQAPLTISSSPEQVTCDEPASCFNTIGAVVSPKEHTQGGLLAIVPVAELFTSTDLAVSYIPETYLIKQVGVRVKDYTADLIGLVGSGFRAGAAISGAFEKAGPQQKLLSLPFVIDVDEARKRQDWTEVGERNQNWWYWLIIDPTSAPAAVDARTFFSMHAQSTTDVFPISSCREATLYFVYDTQKPTIEPEKAAARFRLAVIDPSKVETIKIPMKGAIKMHTRCGADIESEPDQNPSSYSLVKQLMDQTKAIRETQTPK